LTHTFHPDQSYTRCIRIFVCRFWSYCWCLCCVVHTHMK